MRRRQGGMPGADCDLMQIGHHGKTGGSNDTENLNRPAGIVVYQKTNEVFVADGYGNRRVIVYDADTGR